MNHQGNAVAPAADAPPGLILFEDEHLLAVNKPAELNTHSPAPYAGEGLYDWLRHREPRWTRLAIIQRLDKATSGVMVFAKSSVANRSLTQQFEQREVEKAYVLLTDRQRVPASVKAVSSLVRVGERYASRPASSSAERAETHFRIRTRDAHHVVLEATPLTGRTHQIRVHAAEHGFPILGDALYAGTPWRRLCLHSESLTLKHPVTGAKMTFQSKADFFADVALALRAATINRAETDAFRVIHGGSDGWPGWQVDRLGDYLLSQAEENLTEEQRDHLATLGGALGIYHKRLVRRLASTSQAELPRLILGSEAPARFFIRENGLKFAVSFNEGYSFGLFLDQRDNRRRLARAHFAAGWWVLQGSPGQRHLLNTFAYTCGFSVCAASAGMLTTNVDLSRKYLEWGRRNFLANDLDPAGHEFLNGDVFDWLRRLAKRKRVFDVVVLDPPTFSRSKESGVFRAETRYADLVTAALPLLKSDGLLFASTNAATLGAERFLEVIGAAIDRKGRHVVQQQYYPQPLDFPITPAEPGYLKTVWMQVK